MSGDRKHGRNKDFCKQYRAEGRRERNKRLTAERQRRREQKKRERLTLRGAG